jgi:hypothetical protein
VLRTIIIYMLATSPELTADTAISQALSLGGGAATAVMLRCGMACPGCAMAPFMSLSEAAAAYGLSVDWLLSELGRAMHSKEGAK